MRSSEPVCTGRGMGCARGRTPEGGGRMTKSEERKLVKRMNFLRDLLKEFGLELRGYDP